MQSWNVKLRDHSWLQRCCIWTGHFAFLAVIISISSWNSFILPLHVKHLFCNPQLQDNRVRHLLIKGLYLIKLSSKSAQIQFSKFSLFYRQTNFCLDFCVSFRDACGLWPEHSHRQRAASISQQPHPAGYESHFPLCSQHIIGCVGGKRSCKLLQHLPQIWIM